MKYGLATLVIIMILKGRATFQVLFIVYLFCAIMEHYYGGDQQWRSLTKKLNPPRAFVYFRWS